MTIYLDNSATTKTRKEALNKYVEVSENCFGNPSSLHAMGLSAEKELDAARKTVLETLGDRGQSSVVFVASGSEANNLAILGRAYAKERYKRGSRIITTDGEHASVNSPLAKLESEGYEVVRISTKDGKVNMDELEAALTKNVILVTVMMVNNETGALYDVGAISALVKGACPEALVHIDATQSYLKLPFTKKSTGADLITLSSHKIEGPKGVGTLVIDPAVIKNRGIAAQILGGGQEMGLRSGTENVPAIAAFAEAARLGYAELAEHYAYTTTLREYLIEKFSTDPALSGYTLTLPESHAPHILNVTSPGIKSETLLHYLSSEGIYVSSGSACSSNSTHASSAIVAYGKSVDEADRSVRISLSPRNTKEELDALGEALGRAAVKLARIRK